MIRLYCKLLELWDRFYTSHDKAAKLTVSGVLLLVCIVTAAVQLHQLLTR